MKNFRDLVSHYTYNKLEKFKELYFYFSLIII